MTDQRIDTLARAFADAAHALAEALLQKHAEIVPTVEAAIQTGATVLIALQIDPIEPAIKLVLVDDYGQANAVLTIAGAVPVRQ